MNIYFWRSVTDRLYSWVKPQLRQKIFVMEQELRQKDPAQYAAMKSLENNKFAMLAIYSGFTIVLLIIAIAIAKFLKV